MASRAPRSSANATNRLRLRLAFADDRPLAPAASYTAHERGRRPMKSLGCGVRNQRVIYGAR
jgi:hypothetical protein